LAGFHGLMSMATFGKSLRDWGNAGCPMAGEFGWRRDF